MKKIFLKFMLFVCISIGVFCLAACNDNSQSHSWTESYIQDGDRHYQVCDGCGEKLYSEHIYNELDICICGKTKPTQDNDDKSHSHIYGNWTSNNEYSHSRICSCGDNETEEHNWNNGTVTTAATCKDFGANSYTCTLCAETKTEQTPKLTTHSWNGGVITTAATCKDFGVRTYTCTICNETKIEQVSKLATHTWNDWTIANENNHLRDCSICQTVETKQHIMVNDICSDCCYSPFAPVTIKSIDGANVDQESKTAYMFVRKDTETINLSQSIHISTGSWKLYEDVATLIPTKLIAPKNGTNKYSIVVTSPDGMQENTYEFTIYKSFDIEIKYYGVYNTVIRTEAAETGYEYNVEYIPEITGYTFNHWVKDSETVSKFVPLDNIELFANCTANNYNFTFDENGGDKLQAATQSVTFDSNYTLPIPTRAGNTWLGWFDGEQRIEEGISNFARNLTLVAHWQANKYTVTTTQNIQNGTVNGDGVYDCDSEITVTATPYLGYSFIGWYNGESKLSNSMVFKFTLGASDMTVTAKFELLPEMEAFAFSSSETECVIKKIKGTAITEIFVPDYVTEIEMEAFAKCSSVEKLTIPFVGSRKNETDVGALKYLFDKDTYVNVSYPIYKVPTSLKTIVITGGTRIQSGAFDKFSKLHIITITSSIKTINETIVSEEVYYSGNLASWCGIDINGGISGNIYINGQRLTGDLVIPDGVTRIGKKAFAGCTELSSISISNSVESIDDYAFSGCTELTNIEIPDNVMSIGRGAFKGCSNLTSITIPFVGASKDGSINTKFGYIFDWTYKDLQEDYTVYIPSSLKTVIITGGINIKYFSFYNCSTLTNIVVCGGITNIEKCAFANCSSLVNVIISDSVESIGSSVFENCDNLTILCEADTKPNGWDNNWNSNCPIIWGYKNNVDSQSI